MGSVTRWAFAIWAKPFCPTRWQLPACFALFYALNEHVGLFCPILGGMPLVAAAVGGVFVGVGVGLVVARGAARQAETMRWRWSSPKSWDGGFPWPIWQRI